MSISDDRKLELKQQLAYDIQRWLEKNDLQSNAIDGMWDVSSEELDFLHSLDITVIVEDY